jgi:hypothetical protein
MNGDQGHYRYQNVDVDHASLVCPHHPGACSHLAEHDPALVDQAEDHFLQDEVAHDADEQHLFHLVEYLLHLLHCVALPSRLVVVGWN